MKDTGNNTIPRSLQLIAGRTAQEYNLRKHRKGAFWEDRYHATAIATDDHFLKCLVYIDMNLVRAGVVSHPSLWLHGGYQEIFQPRNRYRIIDLPCLTDLTGCNDIQTLQKQHQHWLDKAVMMNDITRDPAWSESLAVGCEAFVGDVQTFLGVKGRNRKVFMKEEKHILRESSARYNAHFDKKNDDLSTNNGLLWNAF